MEGLTPLAGRCEDAIGQRVPSDVECVFRGPSPADGATAVRTAGRSAHRRREVDVVAVLHPRPLGLRGSKVMLLLPRRCHHRRAFDDRRVP